MQTTRPTHEALLPRSTMFLAIFVNKMKPVWKTRGEKKNQLWLSIMSTKYHELERY